MAQEWYVAKNEQRLGPFSQEDLQRFLTEGRVDSSDLVWREGMGTWEPARNILGLTDRIPAATRARPRRAEALDFEEDDGYGRGRRGIRRPVGPTPQFPGRLITPGFFFLTSLMLLLPWVDVRCDGFTAVSQSGVQLAIGGYTKSPLNDPGRPNFQQGVMDQDKVKPAPLIIAFIVLIVIGLVVSVAAPVGLVRLISAGGCAAACIMLLIVQMAMGFPIQENVNRANADPAFQQQFGPGAGVFNLGGPRLTVSSDVGLWFALLLTAGVAGGLLLEHLVIFRKPTPVRRADY